MSGPFGRFGNSAAGASPSSSFQNRIESSTFEVMRQLDTTYLSVVTGGGFGATSTDSQTVAHATWIPAVLWQLVRGYVSGIGASRMSESDTTFIEDLASDADDWTSSSVRLQAQLKIAPGLSTATLASLPTLDLNRNNYEGVWLACQAVGAQAVDDLRRMRNAGTPARFQEAFQAILLALEPNAAVLLHLQRRWMDQSSSDARFETARQAIPMATALYTAGQQLWAPYLLGKVYQDCLRKELSLDELNLGFDPWDLTDPLVRKERHDDPRSIQELTRFWNRYGHPTQTGALLAELREARAARRVRYVDGSAFPYCPWPAKWLAVRPLDLGGVTLKPGDYFALYAGRNAKNAYVSEIRKAGRIKLRLQLMR